MRRLAMMLGRLCRAHVDGLLAEPLRSDCTSCSGRVRVPLPVTVTVNRSSGGLPDRPVGDVTFAAERAKTSLPVRLSHQAAQLADLVDFHDHDFQNSWYDPGTGQLVIGVVTKPRAVNC